MALDILETELLPSDVIKIKFYRPPNFKYLSGQWVRLACTAFRTNEYHSFTLTSAPHENFLSCHIKAHGPWTWKLRNYFDPSNFNVNEDHAKVRIRGNHRLPLGSVSTQARSGDSGQGGAVSVWPIWHACIAIRPAKHLPLGSVHH